KINTTDILYISIAVWVEISLYTFIIHIMFSSNYFYTIFIKSLKPKFHVACLSISRSISFGSGSRASQMQFSTSNLNVEFYKWFSGFTDAEGTFMIVSSIKGFSFKFSIGLHIDDLNVLNNIKDKLGFGNIYISNNTCHFNVTKKDDILKLINIFDIYLLNSTKRFDYLDFKKAYYLYKNRDELTQELTNQILDIKSNMNNSRKFLESLLLSPNPEDRDTWNAEFKISKEWLLGFIEGDGSFSLSRNTMEPVFSIKLSESQRSLLNAIKEYLKNNLGLDTYSLNKLECSSVISIGKGKAVNNSKPLATLTIKNTQFLNNVFIPFFDEMKFISKKGLDFKDFKLICHAIFIGAYRTERIKGLLIKLSMTMNNFRLSDYKGEKVNISLAEILEILDAEATIEHFSDGRELDINTKKLIHRRSSSSVFEILNPSGEIIIKSNLADSAKEIGVGFNTLKRQLDNRIQEVEYKQYKIKRIGVFKNKM
uniref:hypothetical protein n=1 Tax=Ciborinia camelliae TaxID=647257 RepID=UPI001FA6ABCE